MSLATNTEAWGFESFMERNLEKELLRFTTAGSVDDGKSTLIGRLLHDSKSVFEDQLAAVKKSRINRSTGAVDFSLLTDGLRAEREQGITIDVAYRYFETPRGNSSLRIRPATSNTPATWPPALPPRIWL
jgi:translation elongation factor EF-1alpha